ncbi:hypothetical protein Taro_053632 [Colocasia esculenta]|uniref:Uncharacterized protein n=1 Tax=Colocasia esculenta TaxID=4460 RepID=A0A843XMQ9_COLES|nr:hypothetical protein [Colocasia esculenta]
MQAAATAHALSMHVGTLSRRLAPHPKLFHEELLFSSRLEDGKKVPSIISRTEENVTVEGDAKRRRVLQGRCVISVVTTDSLIVIRLVVVCPGGGTVVFVVLWWYLVEVGVEVELCSVEVVL